MSPGPSRFSDPEKPVHRNGDSASRDQSLTPQDGTDSGEIEAASKDLIDRCLSHAPGAWEEFLRQYGRLIYSVIHKVGLPADDQEEAFQSSVVAVYQNLRQLRDHRKLVAWIAGIAWRQSVDRIRSRSRESRMSEVTDTVLLESLSAVVPATLPDAERVALEQAQHAREALDSLSPKCQQLIRLFFYHSPPLDYAEIARREAIPIGSLGPSRARCLGRMRRFFREHGWIP